MSIPGPRAIAMVLAVLVGAVALAAGTGLVLVSRSAQDPRAPVTARIPALEVLHAWDGRRSAAWSAGDVAALRALYAPGSPAGRADAALLQRYVDRGVRVRGLRMQVLAAQVLERSSTRIRIRVTDRVASATVRDPHGAAVRLPGDTASTRMIVLTRASPQAAWRMARVGQAESFSRAGRR